MFDVLGTSVVVNSADVMRTSSTLFSIMKHFYIPYCWSLVLKLYGYVIFKNKLVPISACGITSDNAVFFLVSNETRIFPAPAAVLCLNLLPLLVLRVGEQYFISKVHFT